MADYKKSERIDEFSEQVESLASYDEIGERCESLETVVKAHLARIAVGEDVPVGAIVAMARALVTYVRDEWTKTQSRNQ